MGFGLCFDIAVRWPRPRISRRTQISSFVDLATDEYPIGVKTTHPALRFASAMAPCGQPVEAQYLVILRGIAGTAVRAIFANLRGDHEARDDRSSMASYSGSGTSAWKKSTCAASPWV
jgi:hypothetical protein